MKKPELLSPVGDFECLKSAVQNGADSVYLGSSSFNARNRATNFDLEELSQAIKYAKLRNVKVHLTLNTLIKDSEFEDAVNLAITAYNLGVDAIIIQDLGLAKYLIKNYPEIPIHASTQMTVHNLAGVKQLQKLGYSRVVLSRELSINEIKNIRKNTDVELEVFIHGALCISYSGQCLFSSMVGDRSGNRGLCAQPCRLPYELYSENSSHPINKGYLLSPRDLNGTAFLPELIKAGIDCFKIEGRLKSPEYVAEVTRYYRKYIDVVCENIDLDIDEIKQILKKELNKENPTSSMTDKEEIVQVFNRGGFSNGHLSNAENKNLIFKDKPNNMGIFVGKIKKINQNKGHLLVDLKNSLSIGDRIGIGANTYTISELMDKGNNIRTASSGIVEIGRMKGNINLNDNVYRIESKILSNELSASYQKEFKKIPITAKITIEENKYISLEVAGTPGTIFEGTSFRVSSTEKPEKALNVPITSERIKDQLSKTGNTEFEFTDITVNLDDGLFIPKISILNDLRRNALAGLEDMVIRKTTRTINSTSIKQTDIIKKVSSQNISLLLNKLNLEEDYLNFNNLNKLYIPLKYFILSKYETLVTNICNYYPTYIYMPPVVRDNRNFDIKSILKKFNIKGAVVSHISQIDNFKDLEIIGNYNLNVFNEFTTEELSNLNINTYTISPELNKQEVINLLESTISQSELIVYGKLPLMTNNYCYLSGSNKCFADCPRLCEKNTNYYLKDRLGFEFRIMPDPIYNLTTIFNSKITSIQYDKLKVNNIRIDILDENVSDIQNIIDTVKKGERFEGTDYTNGKIKN